MLPEQELLNSAAVSLVVLNYKLLLVRTEAGESTRVCVSLGNTNLMAVYIFWLQIFIYPPIEKHLFGIWTL